MVSHPYRSYPYMLLHKYLLLKLLNRLCWDLFLFFWCLLIYQFLLVLLNQEILATTFFSLASRIRVNEDLIVLLLHLLDGTRSFRPLTTTNFLHVQGIVPYILATCQRRTRMLEAKVVFSRLLTAVCDAWIESLSSGTCVGSTVSHQHPATIGCLVRTVTNS